jgi:hypothetical protein
MIYAPPMDKDSIHERGRALEEEYFRKKDRELAEKMRQAAQAEEQRRQMGEATGLQDPALLDELQQLGFTPDTVVLLPLVPVVQMAWAEGGVSKEERALLVQLARSRGVAQGSAADAQLSSWMTVRPDDQVFASAGRLIRALLDTDASAAAGGLTADDVVAQAERIAAASGGFLGIGKISAEEKALLAQITQDLRARRSE